MNDELTLDPKRCALLVQDLQNDVIIEGGAFADSGSPQHAKEQNVVANVADLAAACRAKGIPVIHVWYIVEPGAPGLALNAPLFQAVKDTNGLERGTWGAAAVDVVRVGRLMVGAFQMSDAPGANSVRVYGRLGGEAALLTTLSREGRPTVYPWAAAPGGAAQFVTAWEGPATGRGIRTLRLDLVRQYGDDLRVVWSSNALFPDGLPARTYSVRGNEIRVRYEPEYRGHMPGCEGQTEAEDVFRTVAESGTLVRRAGREVNAWHRELRATVARLFDALAAGDEASLARLVPDARLRRRLPATLRADAACDAADNPTNPHSVSVAATAEHTPWALTFQRAATGWRLVAANPVFS